MKQVHSSIEVTNVDCYSKNGFKFQDAQLVVEKLKSGFLLPSDKEFEDCTLPQQVTIDGSGETLPANSINPNRSSNKKGGLSRFFGNKKVRLALAVSFYK